MGSESGCALAARFGCDVFPFRNAIRPFLFHGLVPITSHDDQSFVGMGVSKRPDLGRVLWTHISLDLDPVTVSNVKVGGEINVAETKRDWLVLIWHSQGTEYSADVRFPSRSAHVSKIKANFAQSPALIQVLMSIRRSALAGTVRLALDNAWCLVRHLPTCLAWNEEPRLRSCGPDRHTLIRALARTKVVGPHLGRNPSVHGAARMARHFYRRSLLLGVCGISTFRRAVQRLAERFMVLKNAGPSRKRFIAVRAFQMHTLPCIEPALTFFGTNHAMTVSTTCFGDLRSISQERLSAQFANQRLLGSTRKPFAFPRAVRNGSSAFCRFTYVRRGLCECRAALLAFQFGKLSGHFSDLLAGRGFAAPGVFSALPGTLTLYPEISRVTLNSIPITGGVA